MGTAYIKRTYPWTYENNGKVKFKMKKHGFTLVEIMVVVSVIGLLAALGSMAIVKGMNKSRQKKAAAELEMLSAAILQLAWDTGRWPNKALRTNAGSTEMWDISVASSMEFFAFFELDFAILLRKNNKVNNFFRFSYT